ncbi:hypothetical protein AMAG_16355 [Allomyces macrogynus ATCC 38327]|uniref:Uncharacterized protein n=1 Tax=Allomyces macrogynus (strain ATCC 38327) TaxID=578462 RepID=A0A0L0TB32_ALLM3|nr:hypothetical protein AMAG_16355 [Allomyces macrogynus ATCC 38327]|eukprot:KNE71931.1 hypothetical protein AMAG_16355 [Allomyces macrogynus ATCC 38327]
MTTSAPAKLRFFAIDTPDTIRVTNSTDASITVLVSATTKPSSVPASAWHTLHPGTEHDFAATQDWLCVYARAADGATVGCYVPAAAQVEVYRVAKDEPILLAMFDLVDAPTAAELDARNTISVHATNSAMDVTVDGTTWHVVAQGETLRATNDVSSETMVAVRFKMGTMEVRGGVLVAPGTRVDVTAPPARKSRLGMNPGMVLRMRR